MDLIFHFSLISTAVSYVVVVVNSLSKSLVKNNRRSQVYFKMSTFLFLCAVLSCFSPVWLCDLRTVAHQAPLSTGFSCLWTEAYLPLDILEWVAMPSFGGSSQPRNWTYISRVFPICRQVLYPLSHLGSPLFPLLLLLFSCSVMSDSLQPHGLQPTRLLHPWDFPGKSTRVGCRCLLFFSLAVGKKGFCSNSYCENLVGLLEVKENEVLPRMGLSGVFSSQVCSHWASSSSFITVQISPPQYWFP